MEEKRRTRQLAYKGYVVLLATLAITIFTPYASEACMNEVYWMGCVYTHDACEDIAWEACMDGCQDGGCYLSGCTDMTREKWTVV